MRVLYPILFTLAEIVFIFVVINQVTAFKAIMRHLIHPLHNTKRGFFPASVLYTI